MWGVGGAGFFIGIDRISLRNMGRRGCLFSLLILAVAVVALWLLSDWFGIFGVALFAGATLVLAWIPITRFEKRNRVRFTAIAEERRKNAVTDSDFRLGEDSSLPSETGGSHWPGGSTSDSDVQGADGRHGNRGA